MSRSPHRRDYSASESSYVTSPGDMPNVRRTRRTRKPSPESDAYVDRPAAASSARNDRRARVASGTSADEESSHLTKTGRVSRALKGKPVHRCSICNKNYTRAEHLRRHQLNHKSEPAWLCDVPGCEKSRPLKGFYREDLLQRHKEEHNAEGSTRRHDSVTPVPTMSISRATAESCPGASAPANYSQQYQTPYGAMLPEFTSLSMSAPSMTLLGFGSEGQFDTTSSYSYPDCTPLQGAESFWEPSGSLAPSSRSLSPASMSLSLSPLPVPWFEAEPSSIFDMSGPPSDYTAATSVSSPSLHDLTSFDSANLELSLIDFDSQDTTLIESEVTDLSLMADDCIGHGTFLLLEDRYMPLFWERFHPSFPTIHRGTFFSTPDIPILLKALMVTAGACFGEDRDSLLVVEGLGKVCSQILGARGLPGASSTIWDLQITFMAEVLGLSPPSILDPESSEAFAALKTTLQFNQVIAPSQMTDMLSFATIETISSVQGIWVESETRKRLQLSCDLVDVHQAALSGRAQEQSNDDKLVACSSLLWESQDPYEWKRLCRQEDDTTAYLSSLIDDSKWPGGVVKQAMTTLNRLKCRRRP